MIRKAILLLFAALSVDATCAETGTARFASRPFTADDGTALIVTEGTVLVPENRSATGSKMIELAVVRVSRSEKPTAKAHIVLAGGPGDSGVTLVLGLAQHGGSRILDLLGADVIGIDQRGSGRSKPSLRTERFVGLPLDQPGTPETWLPLIEKACADVARELAGRGIHLPSYNTRESADDVDAVRRALAYERVVRWGRSYGSHLALAVLRRHPKAVERVILVNPEGPDHTFKLPSHVDAVLERLDQRNGTGAGLREQMRAVLERLERSPVFVEVRHPQSGEMVRVGIGRFDLELLTSRALGDSRLIATLPAAYADMENGDFSRIAPLVMAARARMGVESAMKAVMDLSSGATTPRRRQIEHEAKDALLGNAINFPLMSVANVWGNPDLGDAFRQPVRSKVPVLVFAGDLDPRTPVENGREILRSLPNGHLVVVAGATHNFDFFGSPQIRAVVGDFLRGEAITTSQLEISERTH